MKFNQIRFHHQLYLKLRSYRRYGDGYCFALNRKLGPNGRIEGHELEGKRISIGTYWVEPHRQKIYTVDKVCCHWYEGYYIVASIVDENGSHGQIFVKNINCTNNTMLGMINNVKYKLL